MGQIPPTIVRYPQRPQSQLPTVAWLKLPNSAVFIQNDKSSQPLRQSFWWSKSKQIILWPVHEAEQNRTHWLGAELALQCCQEEECMVVSWLGTCVKGNTQGIGIYCIKMSFCSPISADSEEALREVCGREWACGLWNKIKEGIFERNWKEKGKLICWSVRSYKTPLEELLKKGLYLLWRGSKQFRPTILLPSLVF